MDIGANEGQCAALLREAFPSTPIISFEPLADCYDKVASFLKDNGPGEAWHCALGEANGTATINRNKFTPSSSLLPMEELHRQEFPQTVETYPEEISIRRLDEVAKEIELNDPCLLYTSPSPRDLSTSRMPSSA